MSAGVRARKRLESVNHLRLVENKGRCKGGLLLESDFMFLPSPRGFPGFFALGRFSKIKLVFLEGP